MASQIAQTITRQIRDSIDIVDLISDHVSLRRRGQSFIGLCPFHQEKTPSFTVNPSRQTFKCFGCGQGGDVFSFVQLREKVEFLEARRILAARAGIELQDRSDSSGRGGYGKSKLFEANEWAQEQFRKWFRDPGLGKEARAYVEHRQITPELTERFGLGFAPASWDALQRMCGAVGMSLELLLAAGLVRPRDGGGYRDTFYNRLMFPISDPSGRLVGFGGRTLGDDRAKYLNTPETAAFEKGRNLYGLNLARDAIAKRGRVIVVEGYTDCMMAHQFGVSETVATLGTALTVDHVRLLRRYTDNAYLVFDSDEAGGRAADRGLEVFLTQQLDVKLVQVPEGKDPCDFLLARGAEAFEGLLNGARSALEFKWRTVQQRYSDAGSGPAKRAAIEEFLQVVATSAVFGAVDPIQRGLVINQLAKLLAIEPDELHRHLGKIRRRVSNRPADARQRGAQSPGEPGQAVAVPANVEQMALREIMEVLISEPGYFGQVSDLLDADRIEDPELAAVAAAMIELVKESGEFTEGELITRLEDVKYARLITDLQQAGEARRNYAATIERNRQRLEEVRAEGQAKEAGEPLLRNADALSEEDQDSLLKAVASQVKKRKALLPLNMMQRRSRSCGCRGLQAGRPLGEAHQESRA